MPGEYTFFAGSRVFEPVGNYLGLSYDKINLVFCLVLSLPLSFIYYKFLPAAHASRQSRLIYPLVIGLWVMYFCFGSAMKHLLANVGICYLLIHITPTEHVHRAVFIFSMGYLSFIHWYRWWFLTSYSIDITGPFMVLVQKVTSIAFSLHDGTVKKDKELNEIQKKEAIHSIPTPLEYASYLFNFQTVLIGPLSFYSDYIAFIDGKHVQPKSDGTTHELPTPWFSVMEKLMWSGVLLVLILLFGPYLAPESMLAVDSVLVDASFLRRLFHLYLVMAMQRVQYYFGWVLADTICNASGFGFNGYDANGNSKWDLVSNVIIWKVEMASSFKETLEGWNCTTMYWLRRVGYDRTPPKYRTVCTYLLSAWWHGFFPGYYMTFLTAALFTVSSRMVRTSLRYRFLGSVELKFTYDAITFIATKIALAYCTFPFVTMQFAPGWTLYSQWYFFMHIASVLVIIILPFALPPPKSSRNDPSIIKKSE